jgi:Mce-associated membrane protein
VEDQPTDRSDLTDAGAADAAAVDAADRARRAVPVGKRRGRHRTFRPRAAAAAVPDTADAEATVAGEESVEGQESGAGEASVEGEATVEAEAPAEPSPKTKRRRWFRGRADKNADTTTGESAEDGEELPAEEADEGEPDRKPVGPKQVGRRMVIAVAVAAALFVAAGAFGGAMLQPYLADQAVAKTKLNIARTAAAAITTLFTYTPDDMDQLAARSAKYLGGDLKDSYAKQVDALAATNKQNQIKRNAQVVGAAVESLNGSNATAMVYANVTYNSAAVKDVPKIFLVSYRLTMQRKGSDWVITNMPWITSKDLTRVTP